MALVKALIFDLDDTLVGSDDFYAMAMLRIGLNPKGVAYLNARSTVKKILPAYHVCARNRLLYFKKMLEPKPGYGLLALSQMERYEAELEKLCKAQWKKLRRDQLFSKLQKRYRLCVVTNENLRTQLKKMRALDPKQKYFERIFTSEEMGVEKPDTKGFLHALRYLKVPANNCVYIGNSIEGDIQPALRLGMQAIYTREFLPLGKKIPKGVTVIQKLQELEELLLQS